MSKKNGGQADALSTEVRTVDSMMGAAIGMVQPARAAVIAEAYEGLVVEQIVKIEEGRTLSGIYLGLGAVVDVADPNDPTIMRPLQTFRIRHPENPLVVALVMESAQLGRFLRSIPTGSQVALTRLGQVAGRGGRRVNQWVLGHKAPEGGVQGAIDAAAVG